MLASSRLASWATFLLLVLLPISQALKFDIQAHPGAESKEKERCIRNFVARDQLVVVTATISGTRGEDRHLLLVPFIGNERNGEALGQE